MTTSSNAPMTPSEISQWMVETQAACEICMLLGHRCGKFHDGNAPIVMLPISHECLDAEARIPLDISDQYHERTYRDLDAFNENIPRRHELTMMVKRERGRIKPENKAEVERNIAIIFEVMNHFPLFEVVDCTMTPAEVNFAMTRRK